MSHYYSVHGEVHAAFGTTGDKKPLYGWISSIVRRLERRRQLRDLRELDDRLLADVGISPEAAFRTAGRPLRGADPSLEQTIGPVQRS